MRYLDLSRLAAVDPADFARVRAWSWPWQGVPGPITAAGYRELLANLPPLELCERKFGYRRQTTRIFASGRPVFRFHWHYAPNDCAVWQPEWGGGALILDDGGRLSYDSAQAREDFVGIEEALSIGNQSSLIDRTDHAWYAVRPIDCPEDRAAGLRRGDEPRYPLLVLAGA